MYIIQSWPLDENNGSLNENGLQLCIYRDAKKTMDSFSNLKHNNYLPYFMGALFAKEQQCNDALILNSAGRICDSTIANIFLIKDGTVYTNPPGEGCITGIIQSFIVEQLSHPGFTVVKEAITEAALLEADEVFLTNSIYNIRWVAGMEGKKYSNTMTRKIYEHLQRTNHDVFC